MTSANPERTNLPKNSPEPHLVPEVQDASVIRRVQVMSSPLQGPWISLSQLRESPLLFFEKPSAYGRAGRYKFTFHRSEPHVEVF